MHVSNLRTPRSLEDRRVVGTGDIPLSVMIGAFHNSGYRGAYTLEVFSRDVPDSLWGPTALAAVIAESMEGLKRAFFGKQAYPSRERPDTEPWHTGRSRARKDVSFTLF